MILAQEVFSLHPEKFWVKTKVMARICEITGKSTISGNRVSHSNIKTRRKFYPNLQYKRFWNEETKAWIELRVTPNGMRTINKIGLAAALKRAKASGFTK